MLKASNDTHVTTATLYYIVRRGNFYSI